MSILQEYEKIKKAIGTEKYDAIEIYLDMINSTENVDKMYDEFTKLSFEGDKWVEKLKEIKQKYKAIFLNDVIYNTEEWKKFNNWYNTEFTHKNVKILNVWKSDFEDIRCNALLYQNNKLIANIIVKGDLKEKDIFTIAKKMKSLIYKDFGKYANLPKLSKCSKLMKEIYDIVCNSDNSMCYITESDWKEDFDDRYSDMDIERLKAEVKKYKLDNIITFNEGEYKILGYGNLEIIFNDDRDISKNKSQERRR